ncbi:MAG: protein-glutamine gamma-glutamyltransferase [Firmicutes bacterium]|nr:protein-glutamine gamma-glutamyltransferase [Bacillota bacterium]
MIIISGKIVPPNLINGLYPSNSIKGEMVNKLSSSEEKYYYDSIEQLKFEMDLRKNIINASIDLYKSKVTFRTFRKSKCNTDYWKRTEEGGFILKEGIRPARGIKDIFINGREYGTECATAIIIVYYKAILDIFREELFNEVFTRIHLMNWSYLDRNLGITYYRDVKDYLPGDCRYFKNPDVSPKTPEWQGENAIDLSSGRYYGHGIGIKSAEDIIKTLNRYRRKDSDTSAYLLNSVTNLSYKNLSNIYLRFVSNFQISKRLI